MCFHTTRLSILNLFYGHSYDNVYINLSSKPDWYLEILPTGKVPLLLHHTQKLAESDIIMQYLDQKDQSLMKICGEEGFKQVADLCGKLFKPYYLICFKKDEDKTEAIKNLNSGCDEINDFIKGPYIFGNELSLADLLIFPLLDKWECLQACVLNKPLTEVADDVPLNDESGRWSKLHNWRRQMREQEFVKSVRISTKTMGVFIDSHRNGNPQYDIADS